MTAKYDKCCRFCLLRLCCKLRLLCWESECLKIQYTALTNVTICGVDLKDGFQHFLISSVMTHKRYTFLLAQIKFQ